MLQLASEENTSETTNPENFGQQNVLNHVKGGAAATSKPKSRVKLIDKIHPQDALRTYGCYGRPFFIDPRY